MIIAGLHAPTLLAVLAALFAVIITLVSPIFTSFLQFLNTIKISFLGKLEQND